jgi:quercetin dioxygenase-like cupin family protein
MEMDRRGILLGLGAFALLGEAMASAQAGNAAGPDGKLTRAAVFPYDSLVVKRSANGGTSRAVFSGTLPTGEFVEVHETTLPPGQMPHAAHQHSHSEFLVIREGQLEFLDEGVARKAGPNDVVFAASNRLHGLKNVGTTMANYFVCAVGVQTKEG